MSVVPVPAGMRPVERTDCMAQSVPGVTPTNPEPPLPRYLMQEGLRQGLPEKHEWESARPGFGGFLPRSGRACKRQRQCCAGTRDEGAEPPPLPRAPSGASHCVDAFLRLPRLFWVNQILTGKRTGQHKERRLRRFALSQQRPSTGTGGMPRRGLEGSGVRASNPGQNGASEEEGGK